MKTDLNPQRKISHVSTHESGVVIDEEKREKYREEAMNKIHELVKTEKNYIAELDKLVHGYINYLEKSKKTPTPEGVAPMPSDLKRGKDKIAFGNIRDLLDFHQR